MPGSALSRQTFGVRQIRVNYLLNAMQRAGITPPVEKRLTSRADMADLDGWAAEEIAEADQYQDALPRRRNPAGRPLMVALIGLAGGLRPRPRSWSARPRSSTPGIAVRGRWQRRAPYTDKSMPADGRGAGSQPVGITLDGQVYLS